MDRRPRVRVLIGVGLVAGCTLAQQVLLTRMLSAVLFYHFTFLAISLALLGKGAGGITIYRWPRFYDRWPLERTLAGWSALFAATLIVTPYAKRGHVDNTVYDTTSILKLITRRFELEPLAGVRANAGDMSAAFDFTQKP